MIRNLVLIGFAVAISLFLSGLISPFGAPATADRDANSITALALRQMKFNSEVYRDAQDRVPGDSLPALVDNLEKLGGSFSPEPKRLLQSEVDGWGRGLVLEKTSETTWMLRSLGPNGVDDHGQADDLEVDLHPFPRPEPTGGESGSCNCSADEEEPPKPSPAVDPAQQPTPAKRDS